MKYVLYHSNCYDGFGSAYAAWKSLGETAKYIPVSYGSPLPEMPEAEHIYIVDFSYPAETLLKLADTAPVTVIDHHKTAKEALADVIGKHSHLHTIFDMEKSGALLTWEYFHRHYGPSPADSEPILAPMLIRHISDRDLWQFKLPGSKEVHQSLVSMPMSFELWDKLNVHDLIIEGRALLRQYQQLVDNICQKPFMVQIGEYTVPAVNTSVAWSEVGAKLGDLYPDAPFVACFTEFGDQTMWSLRTSKNSRAFDVSAVAKVFGGGGHAAAAGFKTVRTSPISVVSP